VSALFLGPAAGALDDIAELGILNRLLPGQRFHRIHAGSIPASNRLIGLAPFLIHLIRQGLGLPAARRNKTHLPVGCFSNQALRLRLFKGESKEWRHFHKTPQHHSDCDRQLRPTLQGHPHRLHGRLNFF